MLIKSEDNLKLIREEYCSQEFDMFGEGKTLQILDCNIGKEY